MTGDARPLWQDRRKSHVGDLAFLLEHVELAQELLNNGWSLEAVAEHLNWPTQGRVTALDRLHEGLNIWDAWTPEMLYLAQRWGASWSSLLEPARWWKQHKVQREDLETFARGVVDRRGHWPEVRDFRARFGFAPTDSARRRHPGQGSLGCE